MFEKELMILGLRRQHGLLSQLVEELELKSNFDDFDVSFYETRIKQVAKNLRRLRRIAKDYSSYNQKKEWAEGDQSQWWME